MSLSTVAWKSGEEKVIEEYCYERNLRIMRYYQLAAVKSIQRAVKEGKTRFLFEMATGERGIFVTGGRNPGFTRVSEAWS